jgi:transposase
MNKNNKNHDSAFKARVALEAIKYSVHPNQIGQWRKHLLEELPSLFSDKRKKSDKEGEELKDELYKQIGQLKVEVDWLKKKSLLLDLKKSGR